MSRNHYLCYYLHTVRDFQLRKLLKKWQFLMYNHGSRHEIASTIFLRWNKHNWLIAVTIFMARSKQ
jgi:hypothetical protein